MVQQAFCNFYFLSNFCLLCIFKTDHKKMIKRKG
uniref:Uncharacterized protein n=1 Tax=Anguilla anguilla TaxID=7936 RepID=A0A0E9U6V2_ANGAN